VSKSFYREGVNEYDDLSYINAFHNFYYILEGMYGGGKTKNRAVEAQLKSSKELLDIVQWTLDRLTEAPKELSSVDRMAHAEGLPLTVDGAISLLVRVRGKSHHYAPGGGRFPTPSSHREYQGIAWFALGVAVRAILQRVVVINRNADGRETAP